MPQSKKAATPKATPKLAGSPAKPLSSEEFRAFGKRERRAFVGALAKAKRAGASGNEMRRDFGAFLSGPTRCRLFREYGHLDCIARSYDAYSDGDTRKGSAHARTHGAQAATAKPKPKRKRAPKAAPKATPTA